MKVGDRICATWSDGLVAEGRYIKTQQGFVIIIDDAGDRFVCNPYHVQLEIINEAKHETVESTGTKTADGSKKSSA